jgi:hypothetical protein
MAITIDFQWERDEAGYDLIPAERPDSLASIMLDSAEGQLSPWPGQSCPYPPRLSPARIARRGGKLVTYRPLGKIELNRLFHVFAATARSETGLLDFVTRFGPLTKLGHYQGPLKAGEDVRVGLFWAGFMDDLLRCKPAERIKYFRKQGQDGMQCTSAKISVTVNETTGQPQLQLKVDTLLDALLLQFGEALSTGHNLRRCDYCGQWFEVGAGTTRRADAKFCSDEHRIAFNSRRRSNRPA